ncbi:MAG TPA: protein-glutamate O-methyltransferase CheR [Thermoanaerobaculia bacterium]|nr:protein-glutamate O-methyltransferase CheR [Thermoanaerobaculia bacterium]
MRASYEQQSPVLTEREFRRFQRLIHGASGIVLSDAKRALIPGRLGRRLRALDMASFTPYLDLVDHDRDERTRMIDCICTNETRFFREPRQFDFLDQEILPQWKSFGDRGTLPKRIRAWSVACSTGEEPFSLAMLLRTHFPVGDGWHIGVLASDLSTRALSAAREGVWAIDRAGDIPPHYLGAYMLRGVRSAAGTMRVRPELQQVVEFRQINLVDPAYAVDAPFELIFCRNVLIYFDRDTKAAIVDRLTKHLVPGGLLMLGHAETLTGNPAGLQHAGPTAYRRVA